jgi:hypothetical protein
VGAWLHVLRARGAADVLGIDGPWVKREHFVIPPECVLQVDFGAGIPVPRRFDLAISLEVAEHIPAEKADGFVRALTELSDVVLFSAAIPAQDGIGHVNEQWQSYWAAKFAALGYRACDIVRPAIWARADIPVWYRQNALVYVKEAVASARGLPAARIIDAVTPEAYEAKVRKHEALKYAGVGQSLKLLRRACKRAVLSALGFPPKKQSALRPLAADQNAGKKAMKRG